MHKPRQLTPKCPKWRQTDVAIEFPMQFYTGNTLQILKIPQFHYFSMFFMFLTLKRLKRCQTDVAIEFPMQFCFGNTLPNLKNNPI